jgi:hypothetical protein
MKKATDAELRGLFVRIRGLARRPAVWERWEEHPELKSPVPACDCSDCMRFRAIGKLATLAINSNRLRDAKPKRARKGKR